MARDVAIPESRRSGRRVPDPWARRLLLCGAIAGPLYVIVAAIQAITRDGFDIRHHAVSLLSNGDWGWIQITNFVATGVLVIALALGMRVVSNPGLIPRWTPVLIGLFGAGLIGAGAFVADPAYGFPPGTPEGEPESLSWHGTLHFVAAGVGFLALIAAAALFARRFAVAGRAPWAVATAATGVFFLLTWIAVIATGAGSSGVNVAFAIAIAVAWAWLTALSLFLLRENAMTDASDPGTQIHGVSPA